jgi:hypothetical protein
VPVVFALTRKKLGEVYGFRKRMSAIALLEVGGLGPPLGLSPSLGPAAEARAGPQSASPPRAPPTPADPAPRRPARRAPRPWLPCQ